jgi:hypothetical protein
MIDVKTTPLLSGEKIKSKQAKYPELNLCRTSLKNKCFGEMDLMIINSVNRYPI